MTETTTTPMTTTTLFRDRRDEGSLGREMRAAAHDADALRAPGMLFFFFISYFTYNKGHLRLNLFLGTTNMNQGDDSE